MATAKPADDAGDAPDSEVAAQAAADEAAAAVAAAEAPEVIEPTADEAPAAWWDEAHDIDVSDPPVEYPHGDQPDPPDEDALQAERERMAAEVAPPSLA